MNAFLLIVGLAVVVAGCATSIGIASFEECVEAGNPVMESYPRQCRADGRTFVEEVNGTVELGSPEFSQCGEDRPGACTLEYNPVCALKENSIRCVTSPCPSFDAVTMGNACTACGDLSAMGHYPGACEDSRFVVCETSATGFDISRLAADSGWICLDVCPGNYDSYLTQIGAEMCILHYGAREIGE